MKIYTLFMKPQLRTITVTVNSRPITMNLYWLSSKDISQWHRKT